MDVMEARLARLERENRRLKLGGMAALAAIASIFLMAQTRPPARVVEAEVFVVKDRRGVELAQFGATYAPGSDVGGAWLAFHDYRPDGGSSTGTFFQGGAGQEPFLQLNADTGKRVIRLRTGYGDSSPQISISGPSGDWNAP